VRVLMVVRPAAGGMKEHLLALCEGLSSRGFVVEVAAPRGSTIAEAVEAAGFRVHEIPLVGPLRPIKDPLATKALSSVVRTGRFDVVHAHGFKAGLVGRIAARYGGARAMVVTAHNHVLSRTDTPAAMRAIYRAAERSLSGLVTRYIAVSDSVRRELVEAYGLPADKVVTVHNGVDPTAFVSPRDQAKARNGLGLPLDTPVVGLAARFSTQKGLRHLLDAAPLLRARFPSITVVIGGEGPLAAQLREHAAALGVTTYVRWPGSVADIPTFLAALDVYVSPAETEALGIALVEAGLAGIPVVATDVGGVPEVIVDGQTGVLVPPSDAPALAAAVAGLLDAPDLAKALARAARERCLSEFAPAAMVERTLDVYAEALASGEPPHPI
jgi:glycosyltransferase involved in cell wall biosynthesis